MTAWEKADFPRMFFNTFTIAGLSTIGAVASAACVAYGFSRFRFPGRNALFLLMLATIILPFQVTSSPRMWSSSRLAGSARGCP